MPDLIVIYGAPLTGKTSLAWALGRSLPDATAIVSCDQLLAGSIAVSQTDVKAELEMAHVQLRLLVANYLKNRYNAIVEGPFLYERNGSLFNYEADIDQLIALMRHLTVRAIVVRLNASEAALTERARRLGREDELSATLRIGPAYKSRYGLRFYAFDTGDLSVESVRDEIKNALLQQAKD